MDRTPARAVVPLLGAAMAIFVFTVAIGILNGTDTVEFGHGTILAHVHSGTLGWITLSIFAATAWIFGADRLPRLLRDGSIVAVIAYVVAFWADLTDLRPVTGTLMLAAMVWFATWTFGVRAGQTLTVPKLSMLLAQVNLVIGGVLGVILGLMLSGVIDLSEGMQGAHPAMMVVGYLILAGVGIDEQLLGGPGTDGLTRGGRWQAWLFFLAGIFLAIGILFEVMPLLGLNLLFEVIGVGIVLTRHRSRLASAGWGTPSPARFGAASVLFLIPALVILGYVIVRYSEDIEATPTRVLLALDHATFIGILTNAIFGMLFLAAATRREVWSWADQVVFWAINLGVAGFVIGLLADAAEVKRIATPIMGAGILLGLLVVAMRLRAGMGATVPATEPGA
ncbi:MAG TPA: hypothetical protein VG993_07350 [Actinomycetota bacterium]|nr:hypothetical protein [Actinomycetota bacterium]